MPGLNLTGRAQPGDYLLGRGRLYLAPLLADGTPDCYRDVGNATDLSLTVTTESVEHQSSRQGTRVVDADCILSLKIEIGFTLDEMNYQNLAQFFLGDATAAAFTNPAIAGVTNQPITTSAKKGVWYQLVDGVSGDRIYDIETANLSVRRDPSGTPVVLVQGTDYEVDEDNGMIFILSTSATVIVGDELDFTLAADAGANPNIHQMCALTSGVTNVAVKFVSLDGCDSDKVQEWQFHRVNLKPEGELPLIGDEFATMGFTGVAQAENQAYPTCPYFSVTDAIA